GVLRSYRSGQRRGAVMKTPMIASVLELDRRSVKALKITDPYSLHRVVYSLFDDVRTDSEKNASVSSGILWADQGGDFHSRRILLLSDRQPACAVNQVFGEVASKLITPDFLEHKNYQFKVIVNPVRRSNASRKLLPVKGRHDISSWFMDRAVKSWGFSPSETNFQVDKVQVLQFSDKAKRPVTLAQAHLQGTLKVTDREQFKQSFSAGIGRGRAFGCGLLQIVPIMDNPFGQ
ncbi:MAG: type I-E CRISPR-associated protein Cas6/Cse3/CasE, partial [Pontibacterium sp.]